MIFLDYITRLGFEGAISEVENAHRTGRKRDEKLRHIFPTFTVDLLREDCFSLYREKMER